MGVHAFHKGLKVNVIISLELELAYKDIAVQPVSHYTTGIHPIFQWVYVLRERENIFL